MFLVEGAHDDNAGAQAVGRFHDHAACRHLSAGAARRCAGLGQPRPGRWACSRRATPVMDDIVWFHDFLLWLIAAITLFVLALLGHRGRQVQREAPTRCRRAPRTTR